MKTTYMRPAIRITGLCGESQLMAASNNGAKPRNGLTVQLTKVTYSEGGQYVVPGTGTGTSSTGDLHFSKGYDADWSDCWGE